MTSQIKIILHNGADSHVFNPIEVNDTFYHIDGTIVYFETKSERIISSLPFEVILEK